MLDRLESKTPDHLKVLYAFDGVWSDKVLPKWSTSTASKAVMRQIEHNEASGVVRFNIVGESPEVYCGEVKN